ncbi:MAG: c-type cytochrome biogenesis protein CcmI [Alphaproteobacteria bacterium]|nr:c-type cytochrome biogenesis protein CcmI [Alphaproteobacteria bacterium]
MLWFAVALMTLAALALLAWPFVRRRHKSAPRDAYDLTVYRDQLRELDNDLSRGLINAVEADGARLEIQRRMLKLAPAEPMLEAAPDLVPRCRTLRRIIPLSALGLALPAAALSLYLSIGSPNLPSRPFGEASLATELQAQRIDAAVTKLKERLEREPNDLDGWIMLSRSLIVLDRHSEAVAALKRAAALSGDKPEIVAALAESMIFEAKGMVTPEARQLFETVREKNPMDSAALYFIGLAEAQGGNAKAALTLWETLAAATPPDAPWRDDLVSLMKQAAAELGIEPKVFPRRPRPK